MGLLSRPIARRSGEEEKSFDGPHFLPKNRYAIHRSGILCKPLASVGKEIRKMTLLKSESRQTAKLAVILLLAWALSNVTYIDAADLPADKHRAELMKGAKQEKQLVIYANTTVEESRRRLEKFDEKYPFIKTELWRGGAEKIMSRVTTEHLGGRHIVDIIEISAYNLYLLQKKGLLMKYRSPEANFYSRDVMDPEGYWNGLYTREWVTAYNTKLVAPQDVPKRYEDLLDPKWKGKMMLDAYDMEWMLTLVHSMGEEKGLDFMRKLAAQDLDVRRGHTLEAQLVAAGEVPILVVAHAATVERLKKQGAPIEWARFKAIPAGLTAVAAYARSAHPNAAKLFIDFMISAEGQKVWLETTPRNPVRPDLRQPWAKGVNIAVSPPALLGERWDEAKKLFEDIFQKGKTIK